MKHYLKQHETDLLEDLLPPSTNAVTAADNQNPLMQEEDSWSHILSRHTKVHICFQNAGDMQFKSVLPKAMDMLTNIWNAKGTMIGPWTA